MAEYVFQNLEGMLPELEDLERDEIFDRDELRIIIKKRTEMEYKLQRRVVEKEDFLKYLKYELNVDSLRRKRMQRLGMKKRHTTAEIGLNKRVHYIFQKALKKFGNDMKLWMQYIDFCKKTGSKVSIGRALGKLMRLHSQNASVWIMAAKWEFEENASIDNARVLMQKSLRLNPELKTLWLEYFRLELLHVDKIKKRRDILSLSTEGDQMESGKIPETFLANKTASIVYNNAIQSFPDDVAFRIEFLQIYRLFQDTEGNQNEIYDGLLKDFPNSEEAHNAIARRPIEDLRSAIKNGITVSDEDWIKAEESCRDIYNEAVLKFPTGTMYEAHLQAFIQLLKQEDPTEEQTTRRIKIILDVLSNADDSGLVTEEMFLAWSELLLNLDDVEGVVDILSKAVDCFSTPALCERYLAVISQLTDDWNTINTEFKKCISKIKTTDSWSIWQSWLNACMERNANNTADIFEAIMNHLTREVFRWGHPVVVTIKHYYTTGAKSMLPQHLLHLFQHLRQCLSASKEIAEMGRLKYLQWIHETKGIKSARKLYKRLLHVCPVTKEFIKLALNLEYQQELPSVKRIRTLHETAVNQFGKLSADCWLDFINFELENSETAIDNAGNIYWRALKSLDNNLVGDFVDKYAILQTGNETRLE